MSTLRDAARQALEAMNKATRYMSDSDYVKLNHAIDVLREALAQPDEKAFPPWPRRETEQEQEQEPVAWPTVDELAQHIRFINGSNKMGAGVLAESLLEWMQSKAAPPRREWRSLSEEEINEATFHPSERMNTHLEFARAIEAALKERNA